MKVCDKGYPKNCGRKATVFFRIKYSSLRRDNGVFEDVMGFCPDCVGEKDRPSGYAGGWASRTVMHLRGEVSQVQPHDGASIDDELRQKRLNDGKYEFLRIMSTKGRRDMAELWPEVFKLAWEEFQIKGVMLG